MANDSLEQWLDAQWAAIDRAAIERKESPAATFDMVAVYEALNAAQRPGANEIIVSWLDSQNPRQRFDALALIDHFGIAEAVPRLNREELDLQQRKDVEAPFELAKVRRILRRLEGV